MINTEATARPEASGAAFFDVDETLIDMKSMQSFLDFCFDDDAENSPWQQFQHTVEGMSREDGNRAYYRLWSGRHFSDLTAAGRSWFERHIQRSGFLVAPTADAVREHRRAGRNIFLVSGSFHPCLDPLAAHFGASEVFCTELVEDNGIVTGEIVQSRIGDGKRRAVEDALTRYAIPPDLTWAYGDHISDLPMLAAVRHPVAVNPDPQLLQIAQQRRWQIIEAAKRPDATEGNM
jgi:HAD superfamily hydrolase (TIGR01490 family)